MKLQKMLCVSVLLIAAAVMLAGCMSGGNVGVQPEPTADFMPQMTGNGANSSAAGSASGSASGNTAAETNVKFDWKQEAARIEGQINRISEIAESRVVVADDVALVGVKFDSAYKGEMTERIREMVAGEVMAADPKITTVAVTAYEDDVEDIYELSEKMMVGRDLDEIKEEVNEIVRNATTLR